METMVIDSRTLLVKSDNEEDLLGVIDSINQKKRQAVENLLTFVAKHRIKAAGYKFKRENCYDR